MAIDDLSGAFGPDHPRVASALFGLSKVLAAQRDFDAAEEALRRAIAIDERTLPPEHPYRAENARVLEDLRRRAGKEP